MAAFSVVLLTAAPPGQAGEAGGAFVKVDGREAVLRSVELFLNRDEIKQIQIVILPDMLEEAKRKYGGHLSFAGVKVLSGGPRWVDQIAAAQDAIAPSATHVIVHDGARPAVPYTDLDGLMEQAEKHPALMLAAPSRTSLVEVDEHGNPVAYHLPERFMQLLTPHVFSRDRFVEMARAKEELSPSQVALLKASPLNVRVSGPGDAGFVKTMLNMLPRRKIKGPTSPFEEAQW